MTDRSEDTARLARMIASPDHSTLQLRKGVVTAISGSTFSAKISGTATAIPGLTISKPFVSTLAVNSVVWLLNAGPIYLLIHQES